MTGPEAYTVVGVILVGYPREKPWPDPTIDLWVDELSSVGPGEGLAAAREMMRASDFPTIRAFHHALAVVREHHLDEHAGQPTGRLELQAPPTSGADVAAARAAIAEFKDRWRSKSKAGLAADRARVPVRQAVTENDFTPPDPDPPRLVVIRRPTRKEHP
jgi:hypothetical protein